MSNEFNPNLSDEQLNREAFESTIARARKTEPKIVEKIGADRPAMMQNQAEQGKIDFTNQRLNHLESVVRQCWNPEMKKWVTGGIAILGALTFSTGFQAIFKKTGSGFATGGAALVGGALTLLVDDRATKYLGKYRSRRDAQSAIASIEQQHRNHEPQTPLVAAYFNEQKALVEDVEKQRLATDDKLDLHLALGATALEAGTAFIVVVGTGGLLLAVLSAALPVSVIWIAAAFQSDRFDFAEDCANLIPAYEQYLPDSDMVEEEKMLEVLKHDATLRYLSGNGSSGAKSLAQAHYLTEADFSTKRKSFYEKAGMKALQQRMEQHKADLAALPNKFPMPELSTVDMGPAEQKMQERAIAAQKKEWLEQETVKLQEELADDLEFIRAEYGQKVNSWQARAIKAEENARNEVNRGNDYPNAQAA